MTATFRPASASRALVALVLLLGLLASALPGSPYAPAPAAAAPVDAPSSALWTTDGTVNAVVRSGSTLYICGSFTYVGPPTGGSAALSGIDGSPDTAWPVVDGSVSAIAPDASGGWYIGGSFTRVGGTARNNAARIKADKTVDPDWNPNADGAVTGLAVSGSTVYVIGAFANIGGQSRRFLAALDAATGAATAWNPNPSGGPSVGYYATGSGCLTRDATGVSAIALSDSVDGTPNHDNLPQPAVVTVDFASSDLSPGSDPLKLVLYLSSDGVTWEALSDTQVTALGSGQYRATASVPHFSYIALGDSQTRIFIPVAPRSTDGW